MSGVLSGSWMLYFRNRVCSVWCELDDATQNSVTSLVNSFGSDRAFLLVVVSAIIIQKSKYAPDLFDVIFARPQKNDGSSR